MGRSALMVENAALRQQLAVVHIWLRMKAASSNIMARKRPDTLPTAQRECLLISRSVIESSERPTVPARRDRPKAVRGIPVGLS